MLTNKNCKEMSDLAFTAVVLTEKLDKLGNPNTPIAAKLRCAINTVKGLVVKEETKKANWWSIDYSDSEAKRLPARYLFNDELERIGGLVSRGFSCGEIYPDVTNDDEEGEQNNNGGA